MPEVLGMVGRAIAWAVAVALGMLALSAGGCASAPKDDPEAPLVWVELTTSMGPIVVELDRARAPASVNNFLSYVDDGSYEGTIFHRVMKDFVIQGGGHAPDLTELPGRDPIVNEWMNGLKNTRGTIAMARDTQPDTATRQWYINVADNPRLDEARPISGSAGYAVFGRVVQGMDVVDAIRMVPVRAATGRILELAPAGATPDVAVGEGASARGFIYREESMKDVPEEPPLITRVRRVGQPR